MAINTYKIALTMLILISYYGASLAAENQPNRGFYTDYEVPGTPCAQASSSSATMSSVETQLAADENSAAQTLSTIYQSVAACDQINPPGPQRQEYFSNLEVSRFTVRTRPRNQQTARTNATRITLTGTTNRAALEEINKKQRRN